MERTASNWDQKSSGDGSGQSAPTMTAHHKKQGATGYPRDERNGCSSAKARRPVVEADPMRARADGHRAEQAVGDEDLGIASVHGGRPARPGLVQ